LGKVGVIETEGDTSDFIFESSEVLSCGEGDEDVWAEGVSGGLVDTRDGEVFREDNGFDFPE